MPVVQPTTQATLGVAPVAPQGNITTAGTLGNTQPIDPSFTPTPGGSGTQQNNEGLGAKIATKITQAREQYPNQDSDILSAFIRDNQQTHPEIVSKINNFVSHDRAMRNNNPTAMTTDVAKSLGLVEGKDYTQGDSFGKNHELHTANLIGDPIQTTIKAFDKAAASNTPIFQTSSGQPRWTYINMTNQQWQTKTPEEKAQLIATMKKEGEGSSGYSPTQVLDALIRDNKSAYNGAVTAGLDTAGGQLTNAVANIGDNVASTLGMKEFGQGLSTIGSSIPGDVKDQSGQALKDTGTLIKLFHKTNDPNKKALLLNLIKTWGGDSGVSATDINPGFGLSNKDVLKSAGSTALAATAGAAGTSKGVSLLAKSSKAKTVGGILVASALEHLASKTKTGQAVNKAIPLLKILGGE